MTMTAEKLLEEVYARAIEEESCLRVTKWFAEGGVVRIGEDGRLEYLTAEQVQGRVRRGIG